MASNWKHRPEIYESANGRRQGALRMGLGKCKVIYLDLIIGAFLAGFVFVGSYQIAQHLNPVLFQYGITGPGGVLLNTQNIWFDSDPPKIVRMIQNRDADIPLFTVKHPLYRSAGFSMAYLLKRLGVEPAAAIRILTAMVASVWSALIFTLLRLVTGRRLDAILLSILAFTSAAAVFWLTVPEVFSWGSATILVALCMAALRNERIPSSVSYVIVSALTLSMTVTNWMVGILVTLVRQSWRRALQHTVNAFFVVSVLWGVQKVFIPSGEFFLAFTLNPHDRKFVLHPESGGPLRVINSFVSHTIVMPEIQVISKSDPLWFGMTTQHAMPGSGTIWGGIAAVLWMALLATGAYGLATVRQHSVLRTVVGTTVLLQLALHVMYGSETFLYSLHYLPLLIAVAAIGALTRFRTVTLGLAGILIVICGINNWAQLTKAITIVNQIAILANSYKSIP